MNAPKREFTAIQIEAKRRELARLLEAAQRRHGDLARKALLDEGGDAQAAADAAHSDVESIKRRQEALEAAALEVQRVEEAAAEEAAKARRAVVRKKVKAAIEANAQALGDLIGEIEELGTFIERFVSTGEEVRRLATGPDALSGEQRREFPHLLRMSTPETAHLRASLWQSGLGELGLVQGGKFTAFDHFVADLVSSRYQRLLGPFGASDEED